jgi:hypothetical protein
VIIRKTTTSLRTISLAAAFVTAVSLSWCKAVDSADAKLAPKVPKMGYKLVMKATYFGRIEWSVSADGARFSSPLIAIICKAPGFETALYNTETKKMKIFPKDKGFERIGMWMDGGSTLKKYKYSPWIKVADEVIAGRKCTHFKRHQINAQENATHYTALIEEYWVTPMFDLPNVDTLMAPLEKMTSKDFTVMKGFGLRRINTWQVFKRGDPVPTVNDRIVHLDTIECKKAMIDPRMFEMDNKYTKVQDEGEILFSDDGGMPGMPGMGGMPGRL